MLKKSLGVLLCSCAIAFGAQADEVEVALTEETLQGWYIMDSARVGVEGGDLSLGLLLSDERDIVAQGGLMVPALATDIGTGPISVRFGARAYGALLAEPDDDVFGLAPGVEARFALPVGIPMTAVGSIFYAPDIVTFGEADDIVDLNARLEIHFVEQITAFGGFRLLTFDRDFGEDDVVENIQLGVRFAF